MIIPTQLAVILELLRGLMLDNGLNAYIVPAEDEHYTEFVAECHQRRPYISNFNGSAGTAIVTLDYALLWTDGRYYFQAEQELDFEYWTLMKDGMAGTPTQAQWLIGNLTIGDRVGVDPALYTKGQWDNLESQLKAANLTLVDVNENLVDAIWTTKPPCSNNDIFSLSLIYAGKPTSEKVMDVRKEMAENDASVLLIAELDEVAWLLNLRGRDIPSSSTFFSFVILTNTTLDFFVNIGQVNETVRNDLQTQVPEIAIRDYSSVYSTFPEIIGNKTEGMVWVNRNANYKLVKSVTDVSPSRLLMKLTPISLMKAIKNEVEVTGYRKALLRDSAALCEFFAWVENAMENGEPVNETSAAQVLFDIRENRSELFFDKSFSTISATGVNGAIIHYMPTEASSTPLSVNELYLVDSGGLYYDGTTDITRTISFGTPTLFEIEAYTLVLKGQIAIARAIFPDKTEGRRLDSFAREALWSVGLDYNHGTGHGIGAFLNIHEGPQGIGSGYRQDDPGLQENMFTSNEPGYYDEIQEFGIRLENVIRVKRVNLTNNFQDQGFLGFEDLTFVPYSHKLIDVSLLTDEEIYYLNHYQNQTRVLVGEYLTQNNFPQSAFDWMMKETVSIDRIIPSVEPPTSTSSSTGSASTSSDTGPTEKSSGVTLATSFQVGIGILIAAKLFFI